MPQLRQNAATKEWVIIATERANRPEDFQCIEEEETPEARKKCPFCPGNESKTPPEIFAYRAYGTKANTPGWWLRVTENKYPALSPSGNTTRKKDLEFFSSIDGYGQHEVLIETPDHDKTIATLDQKQVEEIFLGYRDRYLALSKDCKFEIILIFKNHKVAAGTSLKHPHSQIVAVPITPMHIRTRLEEAMRYFDDHGECVFCAMLKKEKEAKERIILETDNFVVFCPFASRSPFEMWVLPKKHNAAFIYASVLETKELGFVMRQTLAKLHIALKDPAYNYVIKSAPCHEDNIDYYHWFVEIEPRVVQVAGFELGSGIYINTVLPEDAARFLREAQVS